jgi:hypothetical protein
MREKASGKLHCGKFSRGSSFLAAKMYALRCVVQNYEWGKVGMSSAVALLRVRPRGRARTLPAG